MCHMDEQRGERYVSLRLFSPSAPFDKTANITFSLNADDENVSAACLGCGG